MQRFLLYLKYDGTNYHGWQVQPNGVTVQEVVCSAAEKIFGNKIAVTGCSRTDSGVHANEFCCHFDVETAMECKKIVNAFNYYLPKDISAFRCDAIEEDLHARYSAKGKNYIYKIHNSSIRDPFLEGYVFRISGQMNFEAMQEAAKYIVGKHDFSSFCAAGCSVEDHVRTVSQCTVSKTDDLIQLSITADGFLYNMVRIIAGTLIEVGTGKIAPAEMKEIIEAKSREAAGPTAPPQGLYLNKVFY